MGSRKRGPEPGIQPRQRRTEEVNSRVTEKPASDENARRGDAGMPDVPPADSPGERPVPAPPARMPSSVRIPPRPSAPPTSAVPIVPRSIASSTPPSSTTPLSSTAPGATAPAPTAPAAPSSRRAGARSEARAGAETLAAAETRSTTPAADGGRAGVEAPKRKAGNRKTTSGASQFGKLLSAQVAQLRTSDLGPRARQLGGRLGASARRAGRTLWAAAQRLGLAKVGTALAAVVVLGLVIWWLTSLGAATQQPTADASPAPAGSSSAAPAARGPLPLEGVNPMDFRLGDCFKDFDANAPTSTVVACDTGHSAQLVAVDSYAAADAYPGRDPLKQKALDTCKAAQLTDKSGNYQFSYKLAYPSSSSWGTGDRRVDCYFVADGGNVIKESLIPRL